MSEQSCKCHCHNNHGLPPGSYIRCRCIPLCEHCHPEAFPMQKRKSNEEVLQEIAIKFEYMAEENGSGALHSYLAPLYLQLRMLERLESIDNSLIAIAASLSKEEKPPLGDVDIRQDGKRYKGIILSVEDDK